MTQPKILLPYLDDVDHQLSRYHELILNADDSSPAATQAMQSVEALQRGIAHRLLSSAASSPVVELHQVLQAQQMVDRIRCIVDHAAGQTEAGLGSPWSEDYIKELHRTLTVLGPESELPPVPPPPSPHR